MNKSLLKIENEKQEKKKNDEVIEEILATGDESKAKGDKAVAEVEKKNIHAENEQIATQIQKAVDKRRFTDMSYLSQVRETASDYLATLDAKDYNGWRVKVYVTKGEVISLNNRPFKTEKGLLGIIISPEGRQYYRAIKMSFDPYVDVLAARQLAISIEDSLDSYSGKVL